MKRQISILGLVLMGTSFAFAQGASNIRINEVMTNNTQSLQDGYGYRHPWVELVNTAYSTYNVRGMYITTDRRVLDKTLSVPERMRMMSIIPNDDELTRLTAKQHVVFFLSSNPARGTNHLPVKVACSQPLWVALYDGNAVDLIDSVSVPVLSQNTSYARYSDGADRWVIKAADAVTPDNDNFIQVTETKVARLKKGDPHGFGIALLSMGIVFFSLVLLYVFFSIFGLYMQRKQTRKQKDTEQQSAKTIAKNKGKAVGGSAKKGQTPVDATNDKDVSQEIYLAVIAMALKQYRDDVHDTESGVITIRKKTTLWHNLNR